MYGQNVAMEAELPRMKEVAATEPTIETATEHIEEQLEYLANSIDKLSMGLEKFLRPGDDKVSPSKEFIPDYPVSYIENQLYGYADKLQSLRNRVSEIHRRLPV